MKQRVVCLAIVCLVTVWILPGCMPPEERINVTTRSERGDQSNNVTATRNQIESLSAELERLSYENAKLRGMTPEPMKIATSLPADGSAHQVMRTDQWPIMKHSPEEILFSVSILIFGLIIALVAAVCLRPSVTKSSDALFMSMGMILVITGSLFLITAGYSNQQITPVIGLLGTIAGYVLGYRSHAKANNDNQPPGQIPPA